jgi:lactate dehydrogenase-like 2-hydroxyacid dehydrogenase
LKRVFITRPLPAAVIAEAEKHFRVEVRDKTTPLTRTERRAAMALYDGILPTLGDNFNEQVLQGGPHRCKILANFGVGYNHIDVAQATENGVRVSNTPGAVTDATADIALMLMLMTCRRASEGERMVRSGQWEGWHPTQMLGMHLSGKRLGIVGMGRIGQAIARRAHFGFGMEVAYYNRSTKSVDIPATQIRSLTTLAANVDLLVVAVPGGPDTKALINNDIFNAMQAHAHFVNIARGDVVDENALITALQTGQIAGAGLDVYENEPDVPPALRKLDNVTLLPHLGTAASEVRTAMGMLAVENLRSFFEGEGLPNAVN